MSGCMHEWPARRTELVSERQAVRMLSRLAIAPRQARRALHAGLAGQPLRTAVANLYDVERVQDLLNWPEVMAEEGRAACPNGLLVARRFVPGSARREEQLIAATADWDIAPGSRIWFYRWFEDFGPMPVVVTVAGFVLLGGELTGFRRISQTDRRKVTLVVQEADGWFTAFERHRLSTASGNAWKVVGLRDRGLPRQG